MNKHLIWVVGLVLMTAIICGTLLWINHNSWTMRFEMDDNTKEAIESIEYPIVNEIPDTYFNAFKNCTLVQTRCECAEWGCLAVCYKCDDVNVVNDEVKG